MTMRSRLRARTGGLVFALVCSAICAASAAPASRPGGHAPSDKAVRVTFLHINDTHGQIESYEGRGGYARLATAVEEARRLDRSAGVARTFLVDCGDILSRGDELTRRTLGSANFELMNLLGFDAYVPGNGDYYDGLVVLRARMRQARFPTLTSNVTFGPKVPPAQDSKAHGKPSVGISGEAPGEKAHPSEVGFDGRAVLGKEYLIERAGPVRIALLGLCTVREPERLMGVEDGVASVKRLAPALREQADAVVVLSHLGLRRDFELATSVGGIGVILGGHTHATLPQGITMPAPGGGRVLLAQAGEQLNFLGRVDLVFEPAAEGYRLASAKASLIELGPKLREDPQVKAKIARLSGLGATRPALQPAGQ